MNILANFENTLGNTNVRENMYTRSKHPNLLQFDGWQKFKHLSHFSTTSQGGVSDGNYASFNLGEYSGDEPLNVEVNRRFLARILDIEYNNLYFPHQTHGDSICVIDEDFIALSPEEKRASLEGVDALMTNIKNIGIGVTTADCVPIVLYDPKIEVVAAIHAGWKGTVKHIANKTLKLMMQRFGSNLSDIYAGIGPFISEKHFEVGDEVEAAFKKEGFPLSKIASRNKETNKLHIDLGKANKHDLMSLGMNSDNIEIANLCTYSNPNILFSARRQTIHSGRMFTGGFLR